MRYPRHAQWRTRLLAWANGVRHQPYVWGKTDCASLARAALDEMFCRSVTAHIPGWTSKRTALRALAAFGGIDAVLRGLGAELVTLPFARAGDVIVTPTDDAAEPIGVLMYVDPWCVSSTPETGVQWVARGDLAPESRVYTLWEVKPSRRLRVRGGRTSGG